MKPRLHHCKEGQEALNTTSGTSHNIISSRTLRLVVMVVVAAFRRKVQCCLNFKVITESSIWVTVKLWTKSRNP